MHDFAAAFYPLPTHATIRNDNKTSPIKNKGLFPYILPTIIILAPPNMQHEKISYCRHGHGVGGCLHQ